jgi:hypothetical protein
MAWVQEFAFGRCPWCETEVQFNVAYGANNQVTTMTSQGQARYFTLLTCPRCASPRVIEYHAEVAHVFLELPRESDLAIRSVNDLPPDVQRFYDEAIKALRVDLPEPAAVQLRRTLEASAAYFEVKETNLVKSIQKLVDLGLVTNGFHDALTHIRKVGNLGAHATDERLDTDTVERAMRFTTQLLRNLFEVPAELERLTVAAEGSVTDRTDTGSGTATATTTEP